MYAPMGTGILYGKESVLENLHPFHGGGEMIAVCSFEKTTYAGLPFKFEAGTPNVGGNIALGAAVDFINQIGHENLQNHENELLTYAQKKLLELEGIKIYGEKANRTRCGGRTSVSATSVRRRRCQPIFCARCTKALPMSTGSTTQKNPSSVISSAAQVNNVA